MATREKTVCYAFPMSATQSTDAVAYDLSQITIYIPEASPTFTSVFAEIGFQDAITATGGTITEYRASLRLGANAYTTVTETDDLANSGENMAGVYGPVDFTSHFSTNWTSTSMTCDGQLYFMIWSVAGTMTGHDGAQTTQLRLIEQDSGEVRQKQTLSAGTVTFSFTVNDNTQNYCVDAYQDSTHVGRSAWGTGV